MQSRVIILSGPPGAGKSTTARTVAATYTKAVHLHTDDFWGYIASGYIAPYLPESDPQNHTVVRAIAAAASPSLMAGTPSWSTVSWDRGCSTITAEQHKNTQQ